MPEPGPFLSRSLPVCSIIRPIETAGVAKVGSEVLDDHGLFIDQLNAFFELLPTSCNQLPSPFLDEIIPEET
jgi:hypothetical protein